jgi:hypothetical protein
VVPVPDPGSPRTPGLTLRARPCAHRGRLFAGERWGSRPSRITQYSSPPSASRRPRALCGCACGLPGIARCGP